MCLLDYNKENKKYKHITYAERTMIETWYNNDKKTKKEISSLLHKSERTIRREINRGLVRIRGYNWEELTEYSALVAQEKYEYNKTSKGPQLKLDSDYFLVQHIEREITINKKSPEVISKQLKDYGFEIELSGRTIRNAIYSGLIFEKVKQGTKAVLFTLTERMTRQEIIIKIPNKETRTIAKALDKIERRYGSKFYKIFKSITFDKSSNMILSNI